MEPQFRAEWTSAASAKGLEPLSSLPIRPRQAISCISCIAAAAQPPQRGTIRYHQLYVGQDGNTHIARDLQVARMVQKEFTDSASLQYVRAFTNDEFEVDNFIVSALVSVAYSIPRSALSG